MSVQEWVYLFSSYLEFNTHVHLLIDIFLWDLIHMYVSTWPRWIHMIGGRLFLSSDLPVQQAVCILQSAHVGLAVCSVCACVSRFERRTGEDGKLIHKTKENQRVKERERTESRRIHFRINKENSWMIIHSSAERWVHDISVIYDSNREAEDFNISGWTQKPGQKSRLMHVLHLSEGSVWLVCICHILLILFMMEWAFRLFLSKLDYCGSDLTVMLFFQIFNN